MKKRINLQLFADEANGASNVGSETTTTSAQPQAAAAQEKAIDTKEPETAAAGAKEELKYSDADLDRIINKKFAELEQKKQKQIDEATKLANMNAAQKAEYERDKLQKELNQLKEQAALAEMSKTARKMLSEEGITISDELLSMFVNTDAEATKAAVDSYKTLFNEAVEAKVKERLRGETPKTGTGGAAAPISEIDKKIKKYL